MCRLRDCDDFYRSWVLNLRHVHGNGWLTISVSTTTFLVDSVTGDGVEHILTLLKRFYETKTLTNWHTTFCGIGYSDFVQWNRQTT
jgi:hypothetical protein